MYFKEDYLAPGWQLYSANITLDLYNIRASTTTSFLISTNPFKIIGKHEKQITNFDQYFSLCQPLSSRYVIANNCSFKDHIVTNKR